jgi:hypothetical protein
MMTYLELAQFIMANDLFYDQEVTVYNAEDGSCKAADTVTFVDEPDRLYLSVNIDP